MLNISGVNRAHTYKQKIQIHTSKYKNACSQSGRRTQTNGDIHVYSRVIQSVNIYTHIHRADLEKVTNTLREKKRGLKFSTPRIEKCGILD